MFAYNAKAVRSSLSNTAGLGPDADDNMSTHSAHSSGASASVPTTPETQPGSLPDDEKPFMFNSDANPWNTNANRSSAVVAGKKRASNSSCILRRLPSPSLLQSRLHFMIAAGAFREHDGTRIDSEEANVAAQRLEQKQFEASRLRRKSMQDCSGVLGTEVGYLTKSWLRAHWLA